MGSAYGLAEKTDSIYTEATSYDNESNTFFPIQSEDRTKVGHSCFVNKGATWPLIQYFLQYFIQNKSLILFCQLNFNKLHNDKSFH